MQKTIAVPPRKLLVDGRGVRREEEERHYWIQRETIRSRGDRGTEGQREGSRNDAD